MKKLVIFFLIFIVLGGFSFAYYKYFKKEDVKISEEIKEEIKEEKKLKVFDEDSNERMIAVMINNNHAAWPHAGLNESVINYEILAEGGITRIMAIYKGNLPEKIMQYMFTGEEVHLLIMI